MNVSELSVLLVEGDGETGDAIRGQMVRAGADVHWHRSMTPALQLLSVARVDIVVMDQGPEALTRVRESWPHVPVVVFGDDDHKLIVEAMRLGACDYVVKSELTLTGLALALVDAIETRARDLERQRAARVQARRRTSWLQTFLIEYPEMRRELLSALLDDV